MTPPSAYLRRLVAKGNPMPSLFDPVQLGALTAPNRILMAPLTRARATRDHVPTPVMAEYYAQRASAGLILSEATGISREGLGWPHAPGLWNTRQVEAWKPVRSEEHTSELQSLMRNSYAVFCLKKNTNETLR